MQELGEQHSWKKIESQMFLVAGQSLEMQISRILQDTKWNHENPL